MTNCRSFQFGLVLLIMAAMSGLLGFVIIYHYASFERPMQHFAIVIDAGSTQTRSGLFTVNLDVPNLVRWTNEIDDANTADANQHLPLTKLFQVKQVSTCVNGQPLASIQSPAEAQQLVDKCLRKFGAKIKRLSLEEEDEKSALNECSTMEDEEETLTTEEEEVALMDHRVDSVTYLHLGATAGMRALGKLNETRAKEKIDWMNQAINDSSRVMHSVKGPPVNQGFIGIISGSDEAAFGWTSVNFVSEILEVRADHNKQPETAEHPKGALYKTHDDDDGSINLETINTTMNNHHLTTGQSVGTLELGGTSVQIAFQVDPARQHYDIMTLNSTFELQDLKLFNGEYRLATRSDLCLGMSQAILRANFILLRDHWNSTLRNESHMELINPCLQNVSRTDLQGSSLQSFLASPCLVEPLGFQDDFKSSLLNMSTTISFVGTGETEKCSRLLTNLLEPDLCARYFSLCPTNKNLNPPPADMPFVTISGYNHALRALTHLDRSSIVRKSNSTKLEVTIAKKFGGHSIDHSLFIEETRKFCSLDAKSLIENYKIDEHYYKVQCLQLIYINKLLTEFYLFDPATSWRQIKFLLFPPEAAAGAKEEEIKTNKDCKVEIGWTLGLLLNATSYQFDEESSPGGATEASSKVFYHHGASVIFILRATVVLMFACILLALMLIVTAVVSVKHQQRKLYMSPSHENSVQSSWCSSLNQV